MHHWWKVAQRLTAGLLAVLLVGMQTACAPKKPENDFDVLTQTIPVEGKIPVTVLVKYAFSINSFEKAVEEKFPELDIIQVGNYTSNMGTNEYARRMKNDDLTDIVMTWPLDVGKEYWSDRLIDLSAMPFSAKYTTSMLDSISDNGALYYLPGPAQIRGIVYNKTLFREKGWKVPSDFDSFIALCKEIEASGMRSLQLGFGNEEVLDTAFIGYSYGSCFSTPADAQWIENYNNGIGKMSDHFEPAMDTFQQMMDAGIWKASDLDIKYPEREKMLFTRQCAMVEDSVLLSRMGYSQTGSIDEFGLMPFFSPGSDNDWARLYMVCYIGLNKHLTESQNKEKYDLVLRVMDYISTPEGQEALMGDTGAMLSSVTGVAPPNILEIADLLPTLAHHRYAIFPPVKNATKALRSGLTGWLNGTMTREEVMALVDMQNLNPPVDTATKVLGTATEDFSLIETGNFVTDAMRTKAGTDIALFLDNGKDGRYNGKGISGRIYKGEQTTADMQCVYPDIKHGEKGILQTVSMTGENLLKTLEYAIPVDNNNTGWFYYFSGLRMTYAPAAKPGSRIRSITDSQGKKIDPAKVYTIAVMDETVPAEYVISTEDSDIAILDLISDAVASAGTISPSHDGRFVVANA